MVHAVHVRTKAQTALFASLPLFTTKLVKEADIEYDELPAVLGPEDAHAFLLEYYREHDREEVTILLLNHAMRVTGLYRASIGSTDACIIDPRPVFRAALLAGCASIIVVHNHPSGNPEPSREDIRITRQLAEAGKMISIQLLDHLIIAGSVCVSLRERGLFQ